MVKFVIVTLLTAGVILGIIYFTDVLYKSSRKPKNDTLSDLKQEAEESVKKVRKTKKKVMDVSKEVKDIESKFNNQ